MCSSYCYANFCAKVHQKLCSSRNLHRKVSNNFIWSELNDFTREVVKGIISFLITLKRLIRAWIPDISVVVKTSNSTSETYFFIILQYHLCLLNNFCEKYNRKESSLLLRINRSKKTRKKNVRIMFEFLVTTFDYNSKVFEIIGIWELHGFCKVYFKVFRDVYRTSISKSKDKTSCRK